MEKCQIKGFKGSSPAMLRQGMGQNSEFHIISLNLCRKKSLFVRSRERVKRTSVKGLHENDAVSLEAPRRQGVWRWIKVNVDIWSRYVWYISRQVAAWCLCLLEQLLAVPECLHFPPTLNNLSSWCNFTSVKCGIDQRKSVYNANLAMLKIITFIWLVSVV